MGDPVNQGGDGQAPAPAANANATPAAPEATQTPEVLDAAKLQEQVARLTAHNAELLAEKARSRSKQEEELNRAKAEKEAAVQKMKETGDLAGLLNAEKEQRAALEAKLEALSPDAEFARQIRTEKAAEVAAAKADTTLPASVRAALDGARDEWAASKVLALYRAEQATAKPASPTAPTLGAPAPSPTAFNAVNPSVAELETLKAQDHAKWQQVVSGRNGNHTAPSSFGARLAGAFRK